MSDVIPKFNLLKGPDGEEKRTHIRAEELLHLYVKNFTHPRRNHAIADFIQKDSRPLDVCSRMYLEFKGFSKKEIPKMLNHI